MQDRCVTVERRKRGPDALQGGERAGQTAEEYTGGSFLELLTT